MCGVCSGIGVPICATGVVCSANLHQVVSFALLSGSGTVGAVLGFLRLRQQQKDDHDQTE